MNSGKSSNSGHFGKNYLSLLRVIVSTPESIKIHSFRVWSKDYFVGQPSKKSLYFLNFCRLFWQISYISINKKEDARDLAVLP